MSLAIYLTIGWLLAISYLGWRNLPAAIYVVIAILPAYGLRLTVWGVPTTILELTIYIVVAVWLVKLWRREVSWEWEDLRPYGWPLILLGLGLLIGVATSSQLRVSLGVAKGWFVDPLLLFGLIVGNIRHRPEIGKVIFSLWISGVVLAAGALGQVISGQFVTIDQRASVWFSSANYLSLYLVPIIVLSTGLVWPRSGKLNWGLGLGSLLMIVALYFTYSYAGWLALLVAAGLLVWLYTKAGKWLLGISGGLVLLIISQWHLPKFQQMLDWVGRSSSHVRLEVWQSSLLMIKERWLTGIGLGLFEQRYPEFVHRLFHPPLEPVMLHAHNIFLQFWVNLGIIGLLGWLWVLAVFGKQVWQAWRQANWLAGAVLATMAAIVVHGLWDTPYWKNDLSAVFWIVVAMGVILSREMHGRKNLSDWH